MRSALKSLDEIKTPRKLADELEDQILTALWECMYYLLFDLIKKKSLFSNAFESLIYGIRTGRISYYKGMFTGNFSLRASRELRALGAKASGGSSFYLRGLPEEVKDAIKSARKSMKSKLEKIEKELAKDIPDKVADRVESKKVFSKTAAQVNKKIDKSIDSVSIPGIKVFKGLTDSQSKTLVEQYDKNAKLKIKGFTEKQVDRLRKRIRENVQVGGRYENLIEEIQRSYDISASRAKFLANQETRLLTVELKKIRYTSAGMSYYRWSCVHGSSAHPVRPAHFKLNGQIFNWNDPPVTSEPGTPERRNHPGQDYNCRCTAIPVIVDEKRLKKQ